LPLVMTSWLLLFLLLFMLLLFFFCLNSTTILSFQTRPNNKKNFLGLDTRGNEWYAEILENGQQVWAQVRNGEIRNGGINNFPKTYNSKTGLSSPNKPKGGNKK